ncbi:MAG: OprD family outer membrane porin [Acidiferrobacter sp.]
MIRMGKQDRAGTAAEKRCRAGRQVGIKGGWKRPSGLAIGALFLAMNIGSADAATGFLSGMKVTGDLRAYDFARLYSGAPSSQHAFAAGGAINMMSGAVDGFSAAASFYAAHSLGLNNRNTALDDGTLAGYGRIDTFGQAFLQYHAHGVLLRAGDQLLNTPWMNPSDARVVPATYQGLFAAIQPVSGLTVSALRITRYKSRTSDGFSNTDLYNAVGSVNVGGTGGLPGGTEPGAAAVGANYHVAGLKTAAWGYQFFNLAKMAYVEGSYTFGGAHGIAPLVGAQYVRETGSGAQELGHVDATVYGAIVGVKHGPDLLTVGYNDLPAHPGAFGNGDVVSPYTTGYATDPLYTTSMIQGMVDRKTSGHAVKVAATAFFLQRQLRVIAGYARYFNTVYAGYGAPHTDETDLDVTYFLKGALTGLSLRDRVGVAYHLPVIQRFIYNRIMVEYDF